MPTLQLPQARFPWRIVIYAIAILYIATDMYLFHGPLSKMIDRMYGKGIEEQIAKVPTGLIATVNTWPITGSDLNRGVWEYCTVQGLNPTELDPKELEVIRAVVLNRLINRLAVWHFAKANPVPVETAEIDAAIAQVRGHFSSDQEFSARLNAQAMDTNSFREYIRDQVHQRKWLEAKAAKHITISEQEARTWYDSDPQSRLLPQRWRARQIFLATLDKDPNTIAEKIHSINADLKSGTLTFQDAVKKYSEDPRSKKLGGDLGYFSSQRMPTNFISAITNLKAGQTTPPFQTKLGWHIVEITEHLPQRDATFEEMHDEIRAHLETQKRNNVIDQIVHDLRKRSKIWPSQPKPHPIIN